MASLGVAILAKQKNVAESGLSKQLDRADTNSMLSVISADLEASVQQAVEWVAAFAGVEPPVVAIDRDFTVEPMDAQTIDAMNRLFGAGVLDQRTLLEVLRRGEVFGDDFDPEAIIEAASQELAGPMVTDPTLLDTAQQQAADQSVSDQVDPAAADA
jgi:hypothetical protein